MIPCSPVLLVAAAGVLLDGARAGETTVRLAEQFLAGVDDPTAPNWNAAFIHHAGYWSHLEHHIGESSWPLPATASCDALASFAAEHDVLLADRPARGDVFLLRSPAKKRFVHCGIVLGAERHSGTGPDDMRWECHSLEANVTPTGCIGGDRLVRVRRILCPTRGDRVIRWTELDERETTNRRRNT